MAYTKAQLEAIKNTLLASNQPILANQHREQIQSMIDEMYDAQSRADILVGVQADTITGGSDTFIVFRNGEAYQIPLSLLSANTLANLGDVFISNVADGETLVYNAVAERWENQNIFLGFALSNLEDVQLTSLANGDILRYNSSSEKWENTSLATILSPYALLTDLNDYQLLSQKGQANGYAQLDSGAKLPISIIPDSVLGQVEYQGTWNASTNTPTLPATPLKKGDYYVVNADGTQFGIDFLVGDWIISNGTIWEKVDNTDAVTSVFGRLGNIVANASDYSAFYVTLDTAQTITGLKTFNSTILANSGVRLDQAGTSSFTSLINTSGTFVTAQGTNQFGFNSADNIYFAGNNKFGGQLAWNNTGNRTYTLPDASGTLALTSDLGGYVTLDTDQTIAGRKDFANQKLRLAVNGTSQITVLSNSPIDSGSYSLAINFFGFNASNNLYFSKGGDNNGIFAFNNAATRVYTLPDATGTIALTSDLGGYLPLSGGTLTGALNGTSASFTGAVNLATSSGNVGIRVSSALYPFHVRTSSNGNVGFRNPTDFNASFTTGSVIGVFNDADNANQPLYLESSQLGLNLVSNANTLIGGNVGIGTTGPEFKLDVNGTIRSSGANPSFRTDNTVSYTSLVSHLGGARSWQIDNVNNDFNLFIAGTLNSYVFNVTSAGNVGIGTTSPSDKLEIGGAGAGIILASPNGTRYRVTVTDVGVLMVAAV